MFYDYTRQYTRIYNQHPTFPLEDPKKFTVDLLDFITAKFDVLVAADGSSVFPGEEVRHGVMALTALANVIRKNTGSRSRPSATPSSPHADVQTEVLAVIASTTGNSDSVSDIAGAAVVGRC